MEEKVIDRITKLLRLAQSNDNVHQARAAIAKAQQIAMQNNLSIEDIDLNEKDKRVYGHIMPQTVQNVPKYARMIAAILGSNFRVQPIIFSEKGEMIVVVMGLKDDVVVYKEVYLFTLKIYKDSLKSFLKEKEIQRKRTFKEKHLLKNDYMLGFTSGLRDKLQENVERYALVLVLPKEVKKEVEKMELPVNPPEKVETGMNWEAQRRGYKDGKNSVKDNKDE